MGRRTDATAELLANSVRKAVITENVITMP